MNTIACYLECYQRFRSPTTPFPTEAELECMEACAEDWDDFDIDEE